MKEKQKLFIMGTFFLAVAFVLFLPVVSFAASPVIPPAWSQNLEAKKRFVLVLQGQGVLDKETGLVWEQSPDATARHWDDAVSYCYTKYAGKRNGWRLPTMEELSSLIDQEQRPALPIGHPFSNIQAGPGQYYWTSTTYLGNNAVWALKFMDGGSDSQNKGFAFNSWCVRGGHGYDAY
jgi:hypothetical protein